MLYQIGLDIPLCAGQEHRNLCAGPKSQIKDRLTHMDNHLVIVFEIYCPITYCTVLSPYCAVIVTYWT